MSQKDRLIRTCTVLLVLNLCFIWGNSMIPAAASEVVSDGVKQLLESVFTAEPDPSSGSGFLRKAAHFTEFTALGLLLSWRHVLLQKKYWHTLPLGVAAACADETIQFFVPGRSPELLDAGIDACGVVAGMFLLQIGYFIVIRNQPTQDGGKQT